MFLSVLNENEKKVFLELASHAIGADGIVSAKEQEVFNSYAYECEMPGYEAQRLEFASLISTAKLYPEKIRKILLIELWGIVLSDDSLEQEESEWMFKLAQDLEVNPALARRIKRWSQDFVDIIGDGYRLVEGK